MQTLILPFSETDTDILAFILDGTNRYSETVFLEKDSDKSIKIHRNTEGSLWVETDDRIESVTVSNSIGQVVRTSKENRLSLMDLPKGVYIISVKTDKAFVSMLVSLPIHIKY